MASSILIQNEVMNYIKDDYNLEALAAQQIFNDAIDLFHQLSTILDFNSFKSIDHKILSSFIVIIREHFELNDSFKHHMSSVIDIVFSCEYLTVQSIFIDWIANVAQDRRVNDGIKFLVYVLIVSQSYFMTSGTKPSGFGQYILKLLYSNIGSLRKKANDLVKDKQYTMEEIKVKFNSCLAGLGIEISVNDWNEKNL